MKRWPSQRQTFDPTGDGSFYRLRNVSPWAISDYLENR